MAQDASAFVDQDLIYDFLLAQHRLPSIEDLDFLNAEELKTLYEWLLQMYEAYETLPAGQKAKYAQFFTRIKMLLAWYANQIMPLESQRLYRLYNVWSGKHLFTANMDEIQSLLQTGWWKMESKARNAPKISDWPMYRLLDLITLKHFYTMDEGEYNFLQTKGFQGEGIGFYSVSSDQKPLYRLFNPNALFGAHHYTDDSNEREALTSQGWKEEASLDMDWIDLSP